MSKGHNIPLYKRGDKLEALELHKEQYNLPYVIIDSINLIDKIYYWRAPYNTDIPGTMHSGYFFHEAIPYKD